MVRSPVCPCGVWVVPSIHSVRIGQLLCCAHQRIVNIMKLYIESNNIQVELIRFHNKYRLIQVYFFKPMKSTRLACLRLDSRYNISLFDSNHFIDWDQMLQSCLYWHNISLARGKKSEHWVPAHMTFWTESWRPFLIVLVIVDILQQKLSMIAFSYALFLFLRLRYTVEEHSGEILAPGSEYKRPWYDLEVMCLEYFLISWI